MKKIFAAITLTAGLMNASDRDYTITVNNQVPDDAYKSSIGLHFTTPVTGKHWPLFTTKSNYFVKGGVKTVQVKIPRSDGAVRQWAIAADGKEYTQITKPLEKQDYITDDAVYNLVFNGISYHSTKPPFELVKVTGLAAVYAAAARMEAIKREEQELAKGLDKTLQALNPQTVTGAATALSEAEKKKAADSSAQ